MTTNNQLLEEQKKQALALMESAGFALKGDIGVELDEKLPIMGYTTEIHGKQTIVVSERALKGGMAINLLIHEMSHVYRIQSGHPSHNYSLLTSMTAWVLHGKVVEPYQEEIVQNILNNLMDLYADDISFKIFSKHTPDVNLNEFFLSWIKQPVMKGPAVEKAWMNADFLLSAAFAQANLERHEVKDTGGKVEKAVKEFLSQIDSRQAAKYEFFKNFMVNLPDEPSDKEYEKLLIQYLSEFLKLTI